jgi:hypothetical protein
MLKHYFIEGLVGICNFFLFCCLNYEIGNAKTYFFVVVIAAFSSFGFPLF